MYDDILIPLREILHNNEIRICSNPDCKKIMVEGYVIENGMEYYCCEECLHTEITEEEFNELYDDGEGDSYYTEWDYCIHTLKAINTLVEEAPVLQTGELGIVPMTNINKLNK